VGNNLVRFYRTFKGLDFKKGTKQIPQVRELGKVPI